MRKLKRRYNEVYLQGSKIESKALLMAFYFGQCNQLTLTAFCSWRKLERRYNEIYLQGSRFDPEALLMAFDFGLEETLNN